MSDVRGRLKRLERQAGAREGRCPHCPPLAILFADEGGVPLPGYSRPEPCPACGGPHGSRPVAIIFGCCQTEAGDGASP
jgi:hypothetical protein